jgi:hypothetical protein
MSVHPLLDPAYLGRVAETVRRGEANRVPFSDLHPGMAVRHAGEVWHVVTVTSAGSMLLRSEDEPSRSEWVTGVPGDELFVVMSPW